MDNKIHIGLSTDDNYVDFAMIVIRSVARFHPQNGKPLVFHIFTNGHWCPVNSFLRFF